MAHRDEYFERLAAVPLFAELDRDELTTVASLGTDLEIEDGRVMATEGDRAAEAFLVLAGTAKAERGDNEIATFGPGDFFGEMALLGHGHRTATVTATSAMTVRAFHSSEFENLLSEHPTVAVKILRTTALRLLKAEDSPHH